MGSSSPPDLPRLQEQQDLQHHPGHAQSWSSPSWQCLGHSMGTEPSCALTLRMDTSAPQSISNYCIKRCETLPAHTHLAIFRGWEPNLSLAGSKPPWEVMIWDSLGLVLPWLVPPLPPHTHTHHLHVPMKTSSKIFVIQPCFRVNSIN